MQTYGGPEGPNTTFHKTSNLTDQPASRQLLDPKAEHSATNKNSWHCNKRCVAPCTKENNLSNSKHKTYHKTYNFRFHEALLLIRHPVGFFTLKMYILWQVLGPTWHTLCIKNTAGYKYYSCSTINDTRLSITVDFFGFHETRSDSWGDFLTEPYQVTKSHEKVQVLHFFIDKELNMMSKTEAALSKTYLVAVGCYITKQNQEEA